LPQALLSENSHLLKDRTLPFYCLQDCGAGMDEQINKCSYSFRDGEIKAEP
jgi:hypothetical protein